ncbi:MAG: sulfite exporter TauE/SafE family protein [Chitinophagaceae bacterium]|nr:sulfite exporter TauE/SafE family protein [Chitinophagaceae bacterium]
MWPLFATAFSLGLISSFHCVGMCGPLVLALPLQHLPARPRILAVFSYHGGRLLTYAMLGGVAGLLGRTVYLAGFQQWFSIILGILILVWVCIRTIGGRSVTAGKLFYPLQTFITRLWRSPGRKSYFIPGMANGLLPCGMVYIAVAGAVSFSSMGESLAFMLIFGIGTLPALLLLGFSGHLIGAGVRRHMRKFIPFAMALVGVLLILRGLDLGIPFISPALAHSPGQAMSCH